MMNRSEVSYYPSFCRQSLLQNMHMWPFILLYEIGRRDKQEWRHAVNMLWDRIGYQSNFVHIFKKLVKSFSALYTNITVTRTRG